ncbi:MAG: hypothetical protein OXI96_04410 [Acidimicrobiaceae bacterium]|nr:hypothetical protein [Acidimicrobiaceae bacterium]
MIQQTRVTLEPSSKEALPVRLTVPELEAYLDLSVTEALALVEDGHIPTSLEEISERSTGPIKKKLLKKWEQHGWGLSLDVEIFRSSPVKEGPVANISVESSDNATTAEINVGRRKPVANISVESSDNSSPPCGSRTRPLVEALLKRRSLRTYRAGPAPTDEFEEIIQCSRISSAGMPDIRSRSGLSLTDLHLRRLVVIYSVSEYASGVYQDDEMSGTLQLLRSIPEDELRVAMRSRQRSGLPSALTADWVVLWCVNLKRLLKQPRGTCSALTDLYLLLGVWCQEYLFQAENLKYGSLVSPAISDKALNDLVGISSPLDTVAYTATTGRRRLSSAVPSSKMR